MTLSAFQPGGNTPKLLTYALIALAVLVLAGAAFGCTKQPLQECPPASVVGKWKCLVCPIQKQEIEFDDFANAHQKFLFGGTVIAENEYKYFVEDSTINFQNVETNALSQWRFRLVGYGVMEFSVLGQVVFQDQYLERIE